MRLLLAVALLLAVPLLHPAAALLVVNGSAEICYTPAAFGPVVADSKFAEANLSGAVTLPADPANRDGCAPLDGDAGMVGCRVAVLARGTCPFVTKVRNAQRAGCSGVVVTNNRCDPATALVSMGDGGDGARACLAPCLPPSPRPAVPRRPLRLHLRPFAPNRRRGRHRYPEHLRDAGGG